MSFGYTKISFVYRTTQMIYDTLWVMLGNGWKYIFNCVSWFVSI